MDREELLKKLYKDALYMHLIHKGYHPLKAKQIVKTLLEDYFSS